ncbi:hypothetical protein N7468_008593 [Penicillium chermesinum]|uniref:Bromo domain-containing protein n=1 Tax=Penicillium chermesinum TaxID=63820 RepID=A0A9W9NQD2_9EURO|nr:uncharacterized protein N7468_008593 [Penicillium chermesinum]KAJ5224051.1 hypothetical protein N7468_008593 [Penicillium chermesinum]
MATPPPETLTQVVKEEKPQLPPSPTGGSAPDIAPSSVSTANEGPKMDVTSEATESNPSPLNGNANAEPKVANGTNGTTSATSPPNLPAPPSGGDKPAEGLNRESKEPAAAPSAPATIDTSETVTAQAPPVPTSESFEASQGDKMDVDASQEPRTDSEPAKSNLPHHPVSETPKLPPLQTDHEMKDSTPAPSSPSKVSREREADPAEEPAAKRTKVDGQDSAHVDFKLPEAPAPAPETPAAGNDTGITKMQHKFLTKSLSSLKRMHDSRFYRDPVDPLKLNIPSYFNIITSPMDLGTMEKKLKANQYSSPQALIDDFNLMVSNSATFNGPDHIWKKETKEGSGEEHLPRAGSLAPLSAACPRRLLLPQNTTFALGPEGLPVIRRDSSNPDRPKRSIHPPKRDLPYSTKPKKKKFQWELRFCQETLNELMKPKYVQCASPFYYPVDPVALNIPTYHNIIKKPMDLQTIQTKLKTGQYENAKEFDSDIHLMLKNCYRFNLEGDPTYIAGKEFEAAYQAQWAKKEDFLEKHEPPPEQTDSSDNESDAEGDASDEETAKINALQRQIAEMSRQKAGKAKSGKKDSKKSSTGNKKTSKSAKSGQRFITYDEKQIISNGISSLPR